MNPRHAVGLALVGWYLMTPPIQGGDFNENAPISRWKIAGSYDTAAKCHDFLLKVWEKTKKNIPSSGPPTNSTERFAVGVELAACIATDDPRLKGN